MSDAPPGRALTGLTVASSESAWIRAGFRVTTRAASIGTVRIDLAGPDAGRGVVGWSFDDPPRAELLDGLPGPSVAPGDAPGAAHPNGIETVDHVVAFTPDLHRTVAALESAGLDLRRRREGPTGGGSARQAFFRVGEPILEVVEHPPRAREAADAGAPARLWGLALLAQDIDATALGAGPLLGDVRDAIQPGRRIATFTREAGLGLAVAVISPRR